MFIKKLTLSNYRSIKSDNYTVDFAIPDGNPGSGLTIIVGPNNVGKSNLYHALDYLFNKAGSSNVKNKQRLNDASDVIAEFTDDDFDTSIEDYVQENKREPFKSLVFEEEGKRKFKIRRRFENDSGLIEIWNQAINDFKNVAGIDAPIQKWIQFLPLWANTTTEEVAEYDPKSVIGILLEKIIEDIQADPNYQTLHQNFDRIFGSSDTSTLTQKTSSISADVSMLIKDQFDNINIKFKADPPKIEQYIKQIKTLVDDGDETEISEKGSGLQRAIMIALIQIYSRSLSIGSSKKPFFLFIDEPELYLNPQAQKVLLKALRNISANEQVFLVTHSPYFIDWEDYNKGAKIGKAKKVNSGTEIFWLDNPSTYSNILNNHVLEWQQPHLLDTASKEILFSEKILFLEGQEDVGLIKKWSKENGKTLNFDIFGYGVGGVGKFTAFLRLAKDLGLSKVAALYDYGVAEKAQIVSDSQIDISYKLVQLQANDIRDKYNPCTTCQKCLIGKFRDCSNRAQIKSGCFDETGNSKTSSNEYSDFCDKLTEIIHYFDN